MVNDPEPDAEPRRQVPHDLVAEESVLGAMMLSRDAIDRAKNVLRWDDFYRPPHGWIYQAIVDMRAAGHPVDLVTLAAELRERDQLDRAGGRKALAQIHAGTPAAANAYAYAMTVANLAARRRLIAVAGDVEALGYDASIDAVEAVTRARTLVERAEMPPLTGEPSPTLAALLRAAPLEPEWYVKNLLARGERLMIVAMEGGGKSMLVRQLAVQLSQGIHPFHRGVLLPARVRTLLLDLENPPELMLRKTRRMWEQAERLVTVDEGHLTVENRPEGIDVTTRADALWLEERVVANDAALVCLGPLYKLHDSDESDFRAVRQVQSVLDRIRVRYGVSFIVETHAPHEAFKDGRLRISGSRAWMRWPEMVLRLVPQSEQKLNGAWIMDHARPPRDERSFPRMLRRYGAEWPWEVIEAHDDQEGMDL